MTDAKKGSEQRRDDDRVDVPLREWIGSASV